MNTPAGDRGPRSVEARGCASDGARDGVRDGEGRKRSGSDFEPVVAAPWDLGEFHRRHLGLQGAALAPEPELRQLLLGALRLDLDTAVGTVAHPAANPQLLGAMATAGAIAHPLHPATDQQTPALLGGAVAAVRGLQEAALVGGEPPCPKTPGWAEPIAGHATQGTVGQATGALAAVHGSVVQVLANWHRSVATATASCGCEQRASRPELMRAGHDQSRVGEIWWLI